MEKGIVNKSGKMKLQSFEESNNWFDYFSVNNLKYGKDIRFVEDDYYYKRQHLAWKEE
jgi:hypothetical protein